MAPLSLDQDLKNRVANLYSAEEEGYWKRCMLAAEVNHGPVKTSYYKHLCDSYQNHSVSNNCFESNLFTKQMVWMLFIAHTEVHMAAIGETLFQVHDKRCKAKIDNAHAVATRAGHKGGPRVAFNSITHFNDQRGNLLKKRKSRGVRTKVAGNNKKKKTRGKREYAVDYFCICKDTKKMICVNKWVSATPKF